MRYGFLVAAAMAAGCVGPNGSGSDQVPPWLARLISEQESQPAANPPAYIARYQYRGQTVYYLPPRCCDIESNLYDTTGAVLCHPDGGFSGQGDGRCPDFHDTRQDGTIIWRDPRGTPPPGSPSGGG